MTSMIEFNIYRTENLYIEGAPYTIRFSVSNGSQEYRLFVSNNSNKKQASYRFTSDIAGTFKNCKNESLEFEIFKIIKDDIQADIL